jgi:hypothetical protein
MRTQMHQEAFPGEDISDRPLPEESVPGLLQLIDGNAASGLLPRPRPRRGVHVSALATDLRDRLEAHEPPEARGDASRDDVRLLVSSRRMARSYMDAFATCRSFSSRVIWSSSTPRRPFRPPSGDTR